MTQPPRDPTFRREPREPTQPRQFTFPYGTPNNYSAYPQYEETYDYIPPPPPPPLPPSKSSSSRRTWLFAALVLLLVLLIGISSFAAYQLGKQSISVQASKTSAVPTPTLDAKDAVQTGDFSKFIEAFAQLMAAKDYGAIQSATDTENFFAIPLRAEGKDDWNGMYSQLTTGNISFVITYPPITADEEGYTCEGYSKMGITLLDVPIDALDVMYVVGTAIEPGAADSAQTDQNGTVFIFELPRLPSADWLWRGVTFNNQLGCN
jgi:hypothetical protein